MMCVMSDASQKGPYAMRGYKSHLPWLHNQLPLQLAMQADLWSSPSPADVVGVVGIADGIEVELLQQTDVPDHAVLREGLAPPIVMLMPAHALDQDGLTVVQQLPALDHRLPEAHLHIPHTTSSYIILLLAHAICQDGLTVVQQLPVLDRRPQTHLHTACIASNCSISSQEKSGQARKVKLCHVIAKPASHHDRDEYVSRTPGGD